MCELMRTIVFIVRLGTQAVHMIFRHERYHQTSSRAQRTSELPTLTRRQATQRRSSKDIWRRDALSVYWALLAVASLALSVAIPLVSALSCLHGQPPPSLSAGPFS